jgi:gamma-glutamyltranspeptidase / glutathione hydrolase
MMSWDTETHVLPGDRPAGNPRGTRSPVLARHGMIATSQPLASAAGLGVLRAGGNAVDAAVTAAAVLSVVEPTMTGIGGDLFALVFDARRGELRGLNSSGRSGAAARPEAFAGLAGMPSRGALSVTVPGVVQGWADLLREHGTMSIERALAPAIAYAGDGFPVAEIVARQWQAVEDVLARDEDAARVFLPGGRPPRTGDLFVNPGLGRTLQAIASDGADAFYRGPLARVFASHLRARGGLLEEADFASHRADWVDPIRTSFRGVDVCELPPNTQGFVALEMLNILEPWDLRSLGHNSAEYLHLLIEAKRLAFADRDALLADPRHVPAALLNELVSKSYAAVRRHAIDGGRAALEVGPGTGAARRDGPPVGSGDTVCLTVVDEDGNAVSLIQSLFESFGSAVVAGDTGVVFQNRGSLFSLDPAHPNCVAPAKRPFHTLVPAMALRDGRPWLSFGVMGGDMQPQGHVQVILNLLEFRMSIQDAGDAARFRHSAAGVALETGISRETRDALRAKGHVLVDTPGVFGGFQGVLIDHDSGVRAGGSDLRKDGLAIGF